jgi:hypothetical protein
LGTSTVVLLCPKCKSRRQTGSRIALLRHCSLGIPCESTAFPPIYFSLDSLCWKILDAACWWQRCLPTSPSFCIDAQVFR